MENENILTLHKEQPNPQVLVITPLWPGHKVSRETKTTIKRNDTPVLWYSYSGYNNIPTNWWTGFKEIKKKHKKLPPYILPLDRDIIMGRHMLDRMVGVFEAKTVLAHMAFVYCNFEFKGVVNREFPADSYDINKLMKGNYISSNSLMSLELLEFIGGPVMDTQYTRLLDWALWLKFAQFGYVGVPCKSANFVAISSENDISAGNPEDYQLKHNRIVEDFVKPLQKQITMPTAYADQTAEQAAADITVKVDF